jgi:hypothetical protein
VSVRFGMPDRITQRRPLAARPYVRPRSKRAACSSVIHPGLTPWPALEMWFSSTFSEYSQASPRRIARIGVDLAGVVPVRRDHRHDVRERSATAPVDGPVMILVPAVAFDLGVVGRRGSAPCRTADLGGYYRQPPAS